MSLLPFIKNIRERRRNDELHILGGMMFCHQSYSHTRLSLDLHEDWLRQSAMPMVEHVGEDLHMGNLDSYIDILTVSAATCTVGPSADLLLYKMTVEDNAIHIGTTISYLRVKFDILIAAAPNPFFSTTSSCSSASSIILAYAATYSCRLPLLCRSQSKT